VNAVADAPPETAHSTNLMRRALIIGSLGVVYGDIGTSPIYTLRECLKAGGGSSTEMVLGLLSSVFWALMIVVTAKYVLLVMRADNDGEGGIMALLGLAAHAETDQRRRVALLKSYVIPIAIVVLIGLFVVQSRGSERIGAYFGPIMPYGSRCWHSLG
jgi:KUP system potassium uptake protein